MIGIIYQLISPSNKSYIGSTKTSLVKRLSVHQAYLNKGNHTNKRLQAAFDKYEGFTVKILEEFEYKTNKDVAIKEQYYLDLLKPEYNICQIAYTSEMSIITREKIRNTIKGTSYSQERKDNISKGRKGIIPKRSQESIDNISKSIKERCSKPIIVTNLITNEILEFKSIKEAEEKLNICNISSQISGKRIHYRKYNFKFKNIIEIPDIIIKRINING